MLAASIFACFAVPIPVPEAHLYQFVKFVSQVFRLAARPLRLGLLFKICVHLWFNHSLVESLRRKFHLNKVSGDWQISAAKQPNWRN
jgi:hypothetical protein